MKLFKNKIFILIFSSILVLFSLQFYFISNSYKRDTNSYVTLVEWSWLLTIWGEKEVLKLNIKTKISTWDVVHTLSKSLAVIEWWDKSITRLWENSKIIIKENFISEDLSKINISFELLKWKTWSNVVSIFSGESYFKQDIKWVSAAVRWTVFEANYDNDYMLVHKHAVKLTNSSWETKEIYPWEVFSLRTFSIEKLKIAIDETFQKLNNSLDEEYVKTLRENFLNSFNDSNPLNLVWKFKTENKVLNMINSSEWKQKLEEYLNDISPEKKQKVISFLNSLNQSVNFENWENEELYNIKLNSRDTLIDNSSDDNYKKTMVRYSMYDLSGMLSLGNIKQELFDNTLGLLYENKNYVDLNNENVKSFWINSKVFKDIFLLNWENINLDNLKSRLSEIDKAWQDILNKWMNNILNIYQKQNEKQ